MNPQAQMVINSDFPLDKIIIMKSGSFTIPSFGSHDASISHDLPFRPLPMGTWSLTSNFDTSYDIGALFNNFIQSGVESNNADIIIRTNNLTGSAVTFYYRVFGFEPTTSNLSAPFTASLADSFIINTDYNYTKLFNADFISVDRTVTHDLGYRPQVVTWVEGTTGTITYKPYMEADSTVNNITAQITDTEVVFAFLSTTLKLHYRIYLDR